MPFEIRPIPTPQHSSTSAASGKGQIGSWWDTFSAFMSHHPLGLSMGVVVVIVVFVLIMLVSSD